MPFVHWLLQDLHVYLVPAGLELRYLCVQFCYTCLDPKITVWHPEITQRGMMVISEMSCCSL